MSARYPFIAVYIMANRKNGTLYTGVTANLPQRYDDHREGRGSHFTTTHGCTRLVWFERFELMAGAIAREKRIKKYPRRWKINLIEETNPDWRDLASELL